MGNQSPANAQAAAALSRSYLHGFVLCALLTLVPFWLVAHPQFSGPTTLLVLVAFAVLQIVIQLVFFLHMNTSSEGGWSMVSLVFTVLILSIVVALSTWIIWSMHFHMMSS